MFYSAWDHSWLYTIDSILNIITRRHDNLFSKYRNYSYNYEKFPEVQGHMKKLFDVCGSFEVLTIDESRGIFKVNRPPMRI